MVARIPTVVLVDDRVCEFVWLAAGLGPVALVRPPDDEFVAFGFLELLAALEVIVALFVW